METIVRDYPFYLYENKETGEQVMAGAILEGVSVHLDGMTVEYPTGSYEVVDAKRFVSFVDKDVFEEQYETVETEETLKVHKAKKKGGG